MGFKKLRTAALACVLLGVLTTLGVASSAQSAPVACTRVITGTVNGAVIVRAGEVVCIRGAVLRGSVIVRPGGALRVNDSTIIGAVISRGAAFVRICGGEGSPYVPSILTVRGSVSISNSTGQVTLGGPGGFCSPSQFGGSVLLRSNFGGVTVAGNTIRGVLSCVGNFPPPTNGGLPNSSARGLRQCAGL